MSYEFILAPRSDCEDWKKKRRRGVRSFVYLKVRPWESGWLPFTLGWQMGKTFVDKNCSYLPSVSPLLLETAPSLPCYYGYHRSQHSGTAQRHTVVTADWSRSIHPTPAEPIKPHPQCFWISERKGCHSADGCISTVWRNGGSQSAEKMQQTTEELGALMGFWCLVPGASEILLHSTRYSWDLYNFKNSPCLS